MLTREPTLKEAMDFLELNAYEGSNAITTLRMGDIEEILKPIRKLVNKHFNPQPYKFEDLKVGMWVWDDKLNACFLIKELKPQSYWNVIIYANYLTDTFEEMHFEKNRFYPVTKALEYQGKEDKNEELRKIL